MLSFMKKHSLLATGRLQGPGAAAAKQRLLKELASKLNSCSTGATKAEDKWLKSWQDWRSDIKQMASKIRRYQNGTGGGPPTKVVLSPLEEELLAFIGDVVVTGDTNVPDALEGVPVLAPSSQPGDMCGEPLVVASSSRPMCSLSPDSNRNMPFGIPSTPPVVEAVADIGVQVLNSPSQVDIITELDSASQLQMYSTRTPGSSSSESSVRKRRRRMERGMTDFDERLLSSAEGQYKMMTDVQKLQVTAAERQAAAAERQAAAAERLAAVAGRQASVAEIQAALAESVCHVVTDTMQCFQLYLQNQRGETRLTSL